MHKEKEILSKLKTVREDLSEEIAEEKKGSRAYQKLREAQVAVDFAGECVMVAHGRHTFGTLEDE